MSKSLHKFIRFTDDRLPLFFLRFPPVLYLLSLYFHPNLFYSKLSRLGILLFIHDALSLLPLAERADEAVESLSVDTVDNEHDASVGGTKE